MTRAGKAPRRPSFEAFVRLTDRTPAIKAPCDGCHTSTDTTRLEIEGAVVELCDRCRRRGVAP